MPTSSLATLPAGRIDIPTDFPLGPLVRDWLCLAADRIERAAPELTELDAQIGDGDHGINMSRGMALVRSAIEAATDDTAAALLGLSGRLLVSSVGGASGPLYGTLLLEAGDGVEGSADPATALGVGLERGIAGVGRRGRSTIGQKTMLDTLVPASAAWLSAVAGGNDLVQVAGLAAAAARSGCERTREMVAQRGRASYLGERAVGHLDPGAVSSLILIQALADAVRDHRPAATPGGVSR